MKKTRAHDGDRLRSRTKAPEVRRNELMSAALRLFLKNGVAPTTVEQITAGAAVAKGTFYLHFSSKENLLAALGERFGQELLATVRGAVDAVATSDWKGKLEAWAGAAVNGYLDAIRLHDVAFHDHSPPARTAVVDNVIVDHLDALLRAGAAAQAWSVDDARFTAVSLFSALHGVVDDAYVREKRVDRARLVHLLRQLCFRSVGL
jgi:AcrR family transcriptional regulator